MTLDSIAALSDYVIWVVAGLLGWAVRVEKSLSDLQQDGEDRDRYLAGDDDDPASPGLLQKVNDLEEDVQRLDEKLEQARDERQDEHEDVMNRLDDLREIIQPEQARAD